MKISKKLMAVSLSVIMAAGMTMSASAATSSKNTGWSSGTSTSIGKVVDFGKISISDPAFEITATKTARYFRNTGVKIKVKYNFNFSFSSSVGYNTLNPFTLKNGIKNNTGTSYNLAFKKGQTLKYGTDYTVSTKINSKKKTMTVTIKGKGNFCGTVTKTVKI